MIDRRARIVVGFDGSPHSLGALNWALAEACLRDAVVVLCHVAHGRRPSGHIREDGVRQAITDRVLVTGVRYATRRAPTVEVLAGLMAGRAAERLVEAASDATLLVVGARGEGGAGLRLGSVSAHVARHAHGTVIIVPNLGDRATGRQGRQIVVGVDGSTGSGAALDFAFAEAARRQASVCAVHVFDASTMQLMATLPQAELVRLHVTAADTLRGVVTAHAKRYPHVEVCCEVLSGAPASKLTSAAANAELLVLGSRGHGDIATTMLGSTSESVLDNASCPVAVIRADQRPHPTGGARRRRRSLVEGRS